MSIITESFVEAGKSIARDQGIGAVSIVKIPHPIVGLTSEKLQETAKVIFKEVIGNLTQAKGGEKEAARKVLVKPEPETITIQGSSGTEALNRLNDLFYQEKWTDGFPVIPPTPEAVQRMLQGTRRNPDEVIGVVPPRLGRASIRNIAVNAVMAGAAPAYMPVIITAVEAVLDPSFAGSWGVAGMQATTSTATPLLIISGPIAKELDIASGIGCLGRGHRANATIGRALRLILTNIGGSQPGVNDMKCQGDAQEFTFCVAENEDHPVFHRGDKSWKPLNVEKGFPPETSTVTAFSGWSPVCLNLGAGATLGAGERTGQAILYPVADAMTSVGMLPFGSDWEYVLILGFTCAQNLADAGFSKENIREYIHANAVLPWGQYKRGLAGKQHSGMDHVTDDTTTIPICNSPKNINVIVAGGAANFSQLVKAHWTGSTRPILDVRS